MTQMQFPNNLTKLGILPFKTSEVRFAIGNPDGLSTYSWRIWTEKEKDKNFPSIYILCRDIFKELKVSLHPSGRWRMGFTTQAINKNGSLLQPNENRAWDVWDNPPEQLPQTTIAFRLFFAKRDATIRPEQRVGKKWLKVTFIEAPPEGKLTVITLFITNGDFIPTHQTENSFCLASFDMGNNKFAKVIAHGEPVGTILNSVDKSKRMVINEFKSKSVRIPQKAHFLFFGTLEDSSRFIIMTPIEEREIKLGKNAST